MQVLPQVVCLLRAVIGAHLCRPLQGQFLFAHPTEEVMDSVSEDSVAYAGPCFEQASTSWPYPR